MKKIVSICLLSLVSLFLFACSIMTANTTESVEETTAESVEETTIIEEEKEEDKIITDAVFDDKTKYYVVKFGEYYINSELHNGDIEWLVIDQNNDSYLLLSRNILDCKNYNEEEVSIDWKDSTLYSWLNNEFLNYAFIPDKLLSLRNFGIDVDGFVSIMNLRMANKYLEDSEDKEGNILRLTSKSNVYAKAHGVEVDNNFINDTFECGSYWLSDNGEDSKKAVWVGMYGKIYYEGQSVKLNDGDGVRPIISISKNIVSKDTISKIGNSLNYNNDYNSYRQETETTTEEETIVEIEAETTTEEETETTTEEETIVVTETKKTTEEETYEETTTETITEEKIEIETVEEILEAENTESSDSTKDDNRLDSYNNVRTTIQSITVPLSKEGFIDLEKWDYGSTPIEWTYIEPNKQIICNNKPNSSQTYGFKKYVSSGTMGCYAPLFSRCESKGADYDGSLYAVVDYTKYPLDEMLFKNNFNNLQYKGYNVKDLLSLKYNLVGHPKVSAIGGEFVNIVYVDELEEIINQYVNK